MEKFLIAGLGNIGTEYHGTRHNAGFDVVDALAAKHGVPFQSGRLADIAEIRFRGKLLILIKPSTYMNLSGRAVKYWMDKEKISADHVLVVMDDIAIPLAKLRLRASGSDGGHNGLKSIQETLGTTNYARLRFGIGGNYPKGGQVDFVLGKWGSTELPVVREKIAASTEVIESFAVRGLAIAMNHVNKLDFGPGDSKITND